MHWTTCVYRHYVRTLVGYVGMARYTGVSMLDPSHCVNVWAEVFRTVGALISKGDNIPILCNIPVHRLFVGVVVCLGLQVHMLMSSQSGTVELFSVSASSAELPHLV